MNPFVTVIVPYYNQPKMLKEQLRNWFSYTDECRARMRLIVVDDGSQQEPAMSAMNDVTNWGPFFHSCGSQLFRIEQDIPWNRGEARNIGAKIAYTPWIVQIDIDHILPPEAAEALVYGLPRLDPERWYQFKRFRVGAADHTRNKDALDRDLRFGEIKPHIDSYLCTRGAYWRTGGYDLDYSGCLGGGSPFLARMKEINGPALLLDPHLHVHTTDSVPDASANLDRDTTEYKRRRAEKVKAGRTKPGAPVLRHFVKQI